MLQPILRALSQLGDPVFLGVTIRGFLWSLLAFAALLVLSLWAVDDWLGHGGALGWAAGLLSGAGVLLLAVWFFVPAALLIATLYTNTVSDAVERRFYPGLPRVAGAGLVEQGWDGAVLTLQVAGLQVVSLVLTLLLPGVGLVLGYLVTGWAIGRGLFVAVAMRRMPRDPALERYRRHRFQAVASGVLLALTATLPPLNLLVPVIGIATMVHVLQGGAGRRALGGL